MGTTNGRHGRLRRAGFLATLTSGAGLLVASVAGIASVDAKLQLSAQERDSGTELRSLPYSDGGCVRPRPERDRL